MLQAAGGFRRLRGQRMEAAAAGRELLLHRRGLQREAVAASPGLGNGASEGGRAESGGHGAVTTDRNDLAFVRNFHAQTSGAAGKNRKGHGSCPCL